jgi:hypothetical protein
MKKSVRFSVSLQSRSPDKRSDRRIPCGQGETLLEIHVGYEKVHLASMSQVASPLCAAIVSKVEDVALLR